MKRIIGLFCLLLVLMSGVNVTALEAEQEDLLYNQLKTSLSPFLNKKLPAGFATVYGNEQIDFYLGNKTENATIGHIRTSKGKLAEVGREKSNDTSLRIYIKDKKVVKKLLISESPLSEFRQMKEGDKIKIEAVGFVNEIKYFFISVIGQILGLIA